MPRNVHGCQHETKFLEINVSLKHGQVILPWNSNGEGGVGGNIAKSYLHGIATNMKNGDEYKMKV